MQYSVLPDMLGCYAPQPDGSADIPLFGKNVLQYNFADGGSVKAQTNGWDDIQVTKTSPDYDGNGYPDFTTIESHPLNAIFLTNPIACENTTTPIGGLIKNISQHGRKRIELKE